MRGFHALAQPRKGFIYGHFPHRVAHPPRKNLWIIYGSLMTIFDQKKIYYIVCITYYLLLIT